MTPSFSPSAEDKFFMNMFISFMILSVLPCKKVLWLLSQQELGPMVFGDALKCFQSSEGSPGRWDHKEPVILAPEEEQLTAAHS